MTDENLLARITINPEQCHGQPCIRGLRMRVLDILQMLAGGTEPKEILDDFPFLEPDDIRAAVAYAAKAIDHPVVEAAE
ncbi:MAG TPA: DUF433 domain-containing protein [Rhizomicrobium sp.]